MYIKYISDWVVEILMIKIPLVLSADKVFLISIWNLFMLTVFLGIFIVFVKYLVTDNIDIKIGNTDLNYSSTSYFPNRVHKDSAKLKKYFKNRESYKNNISDINNKKNKIIEGSNK